MLYALGLGRVLGHRFLEITHRGRRTGLVHLSVVEVARFDPNTRGVVVVVLAGALADEGFRVAEADHGREALAALVDARAPVDVVPLDLMPNVGGCRVLGALPRMARRWPAVIRRDRARPRPRAPARSRRRRAQAVRLEDLLATVSASAEPSSGSATGTL